MAGIRILRARVAEALGEGASLEEVEDCLIREAPVSAELRSALWLYAWELTERVGQSPAAERLRA
jgi:hypothetical protein